MLAINNRTCFARVSDTHLWKDWPLAENSKAPHLSRAKNNDKRIDRKWSFGVLRLMSTHHNVSCLME